MELKNYINLPYTENNSKKWKWSLVLITGFAVFVFLFLFKPSPYIYQLELSGQFLISLGFGIVTSVILFISKFLIEPRIISDSWTLGKSILWGFTISAVIGAASFFYIVILFESDFELQYLFIYIKYFFYSIFTALLIGSIPVSIRHLTNYIGTYRKALKKAGLLDKVQFFREEEVVLKAGRETNNFSFNAAEMVYISADDNYITVFWLDAGQLKLTLIRGTLKAVEKELKIFRQFLRCHKSYIINMNHFTEVQGHSQNLKILAPELKLEVPVSRSKSGWISQLFAS